MLSKTTNKKLQGILGTATAVSVKMILIVNIFMNVNKLCLNNNNKKEEKKKRKKKRVVHQHSCFNDLTGGSCHRHSSIVSSNCPQIDRILTIHADTLLVYLTMEF